jgi:Fuc2NAc and GlcNAc transferase
MFWFPVSIVAVVGLYVDRVELSPKFRLSIQFLAAIALLIGTGIFETDSLLRLLTIPFWAIFIVGTSNFYNFMDGINGIAGMSGIVAFAFLAFFAYSNGMGIPFIVLPICVCLSCLGFLPFNMVRGGKVFMGDVGSYFLGFTFASLIYLFSRNLSDLICLVSFLFPFYADELTTMAVRIRGGENLARAHRRHLYQLLANEGGIAHWKVALGYAAVQVMVGVAALVMKPYSILALMLFLFLCFLGFVLISFRVRKHLENLDRTTRVIVSKYCPTDIPGNS